MDQRLYVHKKTKKYYLVVNDHVYIEATSERAVAYYRLQPNEEFDPSHYMWIRPYKEFFDGRFKPVRLKEDG